MTMTDDLARIAEVLEDNASRVVSTVHRQIMISNAAVVRDAKACIETLTADNERLRGLLSEADQRLAWESLGFGNDFADRVEAAPNTGKEPSHD